VALEVELVTVEEELDDIAADVADLYKDELLVLGDSSISFGIGTGLSVML